MKWLKRGAIALGILLAILALLPLFISLDDYIPAIQREASARLNEPVTIQSLRAAVFPVPHLTVNGVAIGKAGDVKVGGVTVTPDLFSLLGTIKVIDSIQVDDLILNQKAFDKIPVWMKSGNSNEPAQVFVRNIRLDGAVVRLEQANIGPLDALVSQTSAGLKSIGSIL